MTDNIQNVYIYLRKSRADLEAEAHGEGETLARHRKTLLALANKRQYTVKDIYEEIVSGEKILSRPQMVKLLQDLEQKPIDGVMVMDIDRLGRGDMQDQGLILDTFKNTQTKIITPNKTYDLQDEFDEEYSEFEAFMARKEYKMIKKRMQRGRDSSAKEGNYLTPNPPYGFQIITDKTGRYLAPKEDEIDTLIMMNTLYADDQHNYGCRNIAKYLNDLGIPSPTGKSPWDASTVMVILKNPACDGMIKWRGQTYKGKHQAVIDPELRQKVLQKIQSRYHPPYKQNCPPSNPFAGIAICGLCGKKLLRRPNGTAEPRIMCSSKPEYCTCRSVRMDLFEEKVLAVLQQHLKYYDQEIKQKETKRPTQNKTINLTEKHLRNIEKELEETTKQKNNLYTLLERGVYDIDTYLQRSTVISEQLTQLTEQKQRLQEQLQAEQNTANIANILYPRLKYVLQTYHSLKTPHEKNTLLRTIVDHITYKKTKQQRDNDFDLEIFLLSPEKLPDIKAFPK